MCTNRRHGWRPLVGLWLMLAVLSSCSSTVGAKSCKDWLAHSSGERSALFIEAVESRGVQMSGPDWQSGFAQATAESFCQSSSASATLDDALAFVGVPEGTDGGSGVSGWLGVVAVLALIGWWARSWLPVPAGADRGRETGGREQDRLPTNGLTHRGLLEALRANRGNLADTARQIGGEIPDDMLERLLKDGRVNMEDWNLARLTDAGITFLEEGGQEWLPAPVVDTGDGDSYEQLSADIQVVGEGCYTAVIGRTIVALDKHEIEFEAPDQAIETVDLQGLKEVRVEAGLETSWIRFVFDGRQADSRAVAFPARYTAQGEEIAHAIRQLAIGASQ